MNVLHEDANVRIHRDGRFLVASLLRRHRILSTSMVGGGMRDDCTHVVNHQSCEPSGHDEAMRRWKELGAEGSHIEACREIGVDPVSTALCSTAANMHCAHLARRVFEDVGIAVVATAGVEGNATRAGDPACWHEEQEGSRKVDDAELGGTIVVLAFLSVPCTAGCLAKASILLSEAKTAALWDLRVPSRQSRRLATGTGTDQFAIASPLPCDGEWERRHSGTHNKMGQNLAEAVHEAVTKALAMQNGLVASSLGSLWNALGRFGLGVDALTRRCREDAPERVGLLEANLLPLAHDPQVAAAAAALAEIADLGCAGILAGDAYREALASQAALLACAVSLRPSEFPEFRQAMLSAGGKNLAESAARAVVLGFARKWDR